MTGNLDPASGPRATLALTRHELRSLFYAPLSYLFLLGFLVALAACVFLIADFYATDEASLRLLLVFLPWVSMILVPALAMGLWTAQGGDRGMELALTLPIGTGPLVAGKFLAGFAVLLLALFFTFPFAISVAYLGQPDPGLLFSGYLGAALLLGTSFAVALLAAIIAREPVGAFVLGLTALFILQLLGWDALGRVLRDAVSAPLLEVFALFSPQAWLREMGQGWIAWAGLTYFAGLTVVSLLGTSLVIEARRIDRPLRRQIPRGLLAGVLLLAAVVLPVALVNQSGRGLDLTAEGEFTLHEGTLEILEDLPEATEVTLYWSAGESSVPASIASHARRARNLLAALVARADGRLRLREVDPEPDSEAEIEAQGAGLRRIPMSSGDHFMLGLTVSQDGRNTSIAYLDPRRERLLEYDLALALHSLARERPPRIGVISPHLPSSVAEGRREGLSFMEELKRAYDIAVIPHFKETLPQDLDALLVIDATILRAEMLYAIDQFVMSGGSLLVTMDPFVRFNRGSNAVNPEPGPEINDLSDLLLKYGLRYRGEAVVGDWVAASPVAASDSTQMSFPFWLRIGGDGLSDAHPTTADLNEVFFVEPGAFELLDGAPGQVLVTTGAETGALSRTGYGEEAPADLVRSFVPDGKPRALAVALQGPFRSAFGERPAESEHRSRSEGVPRIFAVADVDWLFDPFSLQHSEVGDRSVVRPLNDNLALLLNLLEVASGDPMLVEIRSRGRLQRPFTRVEELFKQAEGRLRDEEAALSQKAADLEARLGQVVQGTGVTDVAQLPEPVRRELRALYGELVEVRRGLRAVRHGIRSDIEALGRWLTFLNLLAGPILVLLLALGVRTWRRGSQG